MGTRLGGVSPVTDGAAFSKDFVAWPDAGISSQRSLLENTPSLLHGLFLSTPPLPVVALLRFLPLHILPLQLKSTLEDPACLA